MGKVCSSWNRRVAFTGDCDSIPVLKLNPAFDCWVWSVRKIWIFLLLSREQTWLLVVFASPRRQIFKSPREGKKNRLLIAGATAKKAARVDRWTRECASHGQLRNSAFHGLCSLYMETQKLSGRICVSQSRTPLCDPSVILLSFIPRWELRCGWR